MFSPFNVDQIAIENAFDDVVAAYSSFDRHYHTLEHIHQVLNAIATLQSYTKNLLSVQLAAWFHDIVYNTQAQNNEEKSAEYAEQLLTSLGIPLKQIAAVKSLILNTKHHQAARDDFDSQVLIDADLAILAANPRQYQEYSKAIRQEYAWVEESNYITGRTQILKIFLQRDRIYHTPLFCKIGEQAARNNIQAEIQQLAGYGA